MKVKTRKMAFKRFKISAGGIIMRGSQNSRHLKASKSHRQLRRFRTVKGVSAGFEKVIREFLPYSG
ncbi:MAG: 50S ribosomal protein L35 [Patescibacteria group bacterium]